MNGPGFCFLIILSVGTFQYSFAQIQSRTDSGRLFFLGLTTNRGNIITESQRLKPLAQVNPFIIQFDFSTLSSAEQAWNSCSCFSRSGLSVIYMDFKNPTQTGKAYTISGYLEPYLFYRSKFMLSFKGGVGLSYLTKVYDSISNPQNLFFSRHLSFLLTLALNARYQINDRLSANLVGQFNHISNGNTAYPNYGINIPSIGVGLDYQFNSTKLTVRPREGMLAHPLQFITHTSVGRHLESDEKRIVAGLNIGIIKRLSKVNGLGAGGEVFYDGINNYLETKRGVNYKTVVSSISLQHYFFLNRILFGQQLAYYLVPPRSSGKKVYQLYTIEYHITHNWYAGVALKAHRGISDYLIVSVGKLIQLK